MEIIREQRNQDLSWFIDMHEAGKLELNPPYQRKSVWGAKDRKFFLDTIFSNMPCPAIYLQKEITETKVIYNVVDGKQRLQTVIDFYSNKLRIDSKFPNPNLANKRWMDIESDPKLKYMFFNYSFSVEQLQCIGDVQWDEVFNRVNRNQKTLKDQELRHARFNGWFINKAEGEAGTDYWKKLKISTTGRNKRMQDVEFISILMLVLLEKDFVGFPQENIDKLYVKYDFENLDDLPETLEDAAEGEEDTLIIKSTIFQFMEDYERVKTLVEQTMAAKPELLSLISKKTLTHVYSLWCLYALNLESQNDLNPTRVAEIYFNLLEKCQQFQPGQTSPEITPGDELTAAAYKYFINTAGATTEKGPRADRHSALTRLLGWQ